MATHATITFSQPGVQPPVYVTSSLSERTPLEMDIAHEKTDSGDLAFTKNFPNAHEGSYQYKIRLGQDNWILDESKETATDDQGIRNNVIHVEPASFETTQSSTPDTPASQPATLPAAPPHEPPSKRFDNRKDSTMDQDSFPTASVDAGHDAAKAKSDSPAELDALKPSNVPLLVVDKVESSPAHEQDASDAPVAHKMAHEAGAADALPDKVNIVPQCHAEPGTDDEQAAPLFRHESSQHDQSPLSPSMGTIDEESTPSSADHTSSGDGIDTPSDMDQGDEGDELSLMPLLSHETALRPGNSEPANGSLFGHEAGHENHDIDEAPLSLHGSPLPEDAAVTTDSDGGDELDRFPLLEHEGRSSGFNGSMVAATNGHLGEAGPQRYKPFDDDEELDNHHEANDGDAPLLPHERESQIPDNISSHSSKDYAVEKQPDFGHETDGARNFFGRPGRYDIFKSRKNSSLPHRMPPSDAEDEDLNDPSLERFPTNRDQIFQRVASIGAELPEDEATHGHHPNSPQPSVFSQACSSVDLVPVKSYTSLASVPEAEDSDEEEDNHDLDSLPSPIYLGRRKRSLRMSNRPTGFSRDPHATPVINASRQLGDIMQDTRENSEDEEGGSGDKTESINKHDGAADASNPLGILRDAISMPGEDATNSAPSGPEASTEAAPPDSELRQRRGPAEEASQAPDASDTTAKESTAPDKDVSAAPSSTLGQERTEKHDAMSLKHLFGAAFGDRKRASASALVLGGVLAAYYFRAAKP